MNFPFLKQHFSFCRKWFARGQSNECAVKFERLKSQNGGRLWAAGEFGGVYDFACIMNLKVDKEGQRTNYTYEKN